MSEVKTVLCKRCYRRYLLDQNMHVQVIFNPGGGNKYYEVYLQCPDCEKAVHCYYDSDEMAEARLELQKVISKMRSHRMTLDDDKELTLGEEQAWYKELTEIQGVMQLTKKGYQNKFDRLQILIAEARKEAESDN